MDTNPCTVMGCIYSEDHWQGATILFDKISTLQIRMRWITMYSEQAAWLLTRVTI